MPRNTAGVKNPVSNEEFDRIVAKAEARLGNHLFFGSSKVEKARVTIRVESFIDDVRDEHKYDGVFFKAVSNIKNIGAYNGSR